MAMTTSTTPTTPTTSTSESIVLKTDTRGRVLVSRERREAILDEFERSGMSGAAFARHYGIRYTTFTYWRQARRRERSGAGKPSSKVALAEVVVEVGHGGGDKDGSGLRIELPGGVSLHVRSGGDANLAAAVLRELGRC